MKRLLFSFIVLGITSVLAIGATSAYFSDTKVVEGNTFTAGTLTLDIEKNNEEIETYDFVNIKPGDTCPGWHVADKTLGMYWKVTNTGSIDGELTVSVINLEESEQEMLSQIKPRVYIRNGDAWKLASTETSSFHLLSPVTISLNSQESVEVSIVWNWESSGGPANQFQGAESSLDVHFYLEQI